MAFCRNCGTELAADAAFCTKCGKAVALAPDNDDAALRMVIPIGRSGWAIAAGYAGLLALLPFVGAIVGVLAIVFGIVAIRDIRQHSDKHGLGRAWFGIVMGALATSLWCLALWVALRN